MEELSPYNQAVVACTGNEYDRAFETAIEILVGIGLEPSDHDRVGDAVEDRLQALLAEAFMRSPALERHLFGAHHEGIRVAALMELGDDRPVIMCNGCDEVFDDLFAAYEHGTSTANDCDDDFHMTTYGEAM